MQVFSRSSGSVINANPSVSPGLTQGTGSISANPSPSTTSDTTGGSQLDPELLRRAFGAMAMKNPKQASNLTAIYKLLIPNDATTLTGAEKNKAHMMESGLRSADLLQSQMSNLQQSGPIPGTLTNWFKNILNLGFSQKNSLSSHEIVNLLLFILRLILHNLHLKFYKEFGKYGFYSRAKR